MCSEKHLSAILGEEIGCIAYGLEKVQSQATYGNRAKETWVSPFRRIAASASVLAASIHSVTTNYCTLQDRTSTVRL